MSHTNAALTPPARLKPAQPVVDQGVPIREVAARFQSFAQPQPAARAAQHLRLATSSAKAASSLAGATLGR